MHWLIVAIFVSSFSPYSKDMVAINLCVGRGFVCHVPWYSPIKMITSHFRIFALVGWQLDRMFPRMHWTSWITYVKSQNSQCRQINNWGPSVYTDIWIETCSFPLYVPQYTPWIGTQSLKNKQYQCWCTFYVGIIS